MRMPMSEVVVMIARSDADQRYRHAGWGRRGTGERVTATTTTASEREKQGTHYEHRW